MNHNYSIEQNNVILKPLSINDIQKLRIWRNNPENTKYLRQIPYITEEMQITWFKKYLENNDEYCFAIFSKELNKVVGSVSLYNFTNNQAELGKLLIGDHEAHGKKIGYNAVVAARNLAINKLHLKKVILHVYKDNKGAFKIYKSAGFKVIQEKLIENKIEYLMESE